jgi:hypothetical protein
MNSLPTGDAMRAIDMDLIAQRIVKLAELSMLEHLDGLMRSQADSLLELVKKSENAECGGAALRFE